MRDARRVRRKTLRRTPRPVWGGWYNDIGVKQKEAISGGAQRLSTGEVENVWGHGDFKQANYPHMKHRIALHQFIWSPYAYPPGKGLSNP